jgi:hypothetical protein
MRWLTDGARWRDVAFLWFSATGGFVLLSTPSWNPSIGWRTAARCSTRRSSPPSCAQPTAAGRLFVSEKAVGKHTTSIFTKLDLPLAPDDNRRVLAVLAWLRDATWSVDPGADAP